MRDAHRVHLASVTSDFTEALGTRVLEGRGIDASDEQRDGPVIVLSESASRLLSPERSLVGRELPWPLPAGAGKGLGAVAAFVTLAALLTSLLATRRAAGVQPLELLRPEVG